MTIEEIRKAFTKRDMQTKSVYVDTTDNPFPLRVKAIGRLYVTVLHNDGRIVQVRPDLISGIRS